MTQTITSPGSIITPFKNNLKKIQGWVAVIFLIFSGCLWGQTIINEKLEYDGLERTFITYLPTGHTQSVVLAFHGHGGTAKDMLEGYGLMSKANADGIIVVSVDGYPNDGPNWIKGVRSWNAFHCCGNSFETQIDDVGFVSYLIDYLKYTYGINEVFALGFSNGGMLCHRLASELSDKITAIADISGCIGGKSFLFPMERRPLPPNKKVSVLMVHGKMDPLVTYDNTWPDNGDRRDIPFVDGVQFWRDACGYDVDDTNAKATNILDAEIKSYRSSQPEPIKGRHGMMTIVFPKGQHDCPAWPQVLDAVCRFFKQHKGS